MIGNNNINGGTNTFPCLQAICDSLEFEPIAAAFSAELAPSVPYANGLWFERQGRKPASLLLGYRNEHIRGSLKVARMGS